MPLRRLLLPAVLALAFVLAQPSRPSAAQPSGTGVAAASNLRTELSSLPGEHGALALIGLQRRYDNAPDFPAVAVQLDQNTPALTAMVRGLYGEAVANRFLELWRLHIDGYLMRTDGLRTGDEAIGRGRAEPHDLRNRHCRPACGRTSGSLPCHAGRAV